MEEFGKWLHAQDSSAGTISQYTRSAAALMKWLGGRKLTGERLIEWKEHLSETGYKPVTINAMLAAVNAYCAFCRINLKVKYLRVQRRLYRDEKRDLSKEEYLKLINAAEDKGDRRLALLIETIGATGIRVSEVRFITLEAAQAGRTQIALKGKIRDILLPKQLCRKLIKYAKQQNIASGELFVTRSGKSLSRKQIWAEMKAICASAHIESTKVFPHNLRHLFAKVYYRAQRDISKLADLLGHSSIETTRIYLISSGLEHVRQIEELGLVV